MRIGRIMAFAVLIGACSSQDPGAVNIIPRDHSGTQVPGTQDDASTGGGGGGGGVVTDGGGAVVTPPTGDGGGGGGDGGGGAISTDPFKGTTYAASAAGSQSKTSAKTHHVGTAGPANPGKGDDCLSCHTGATAPKFGFAGTIFSDTAGTVPAVDYEVILVDSKGTIFKASTDADGNVWQEDTPTFVPPGYIGSRNATTKANMAGSLTSGSCNSTLCHGGPPQGPIHVP